MTAEESSVTALPIRDLKTVLDLILDRLIAEGVYEIPITASADLYWDIDGEHLYDMTKRPPELTPELTVGRLSDDWQFLSPLLTDDQQAFPLMLIHVAPLLRYIANKSSSLRAMPNAGT